MRTEPSGAVFSCVRASVCVCECACVHHLRVRRAKHLKVVCACVCVQACVCVCVRAWAWACACAWACTWAYTCACMHAGGRASPACAPSHTLFVEVCLQHTRWPRPPCEASHSLKPTASCRARIVSKSAYICEVPALPWSHEPMFWKMEPRSKVTRVTPVTDASLSRSGLAGPTSDPDDKTKFFMTYCESPSVWVWVWVRV